MTVRDAIGDMPRISHGANKDLIESNDDSLALTQYQRVMQRGSEGLYYDHECASLSALNEKRCELIPKKPGSDWRDLPNIAVTLRDGTVTVPHRYEHDDSSRIGRTIFRSDATATKTNSLIPRCLAQKADGHNGWPNLYGRLDLDGYFLTITTNPQPMGKTGRVVHPDQNRCISVRECARAQGFPDAFRFSGRLGDKYRQVGNAVPPPLARAIGLEIKEAILNKPRPSSTK